MQTVERWVTRSDAWTPNDDERLASLVLHHISTGSTQLRAFEDAAAQLGRTAAACGYRWNGVVRKHYRDQIEAAKRDRKAQARSLPKQDLEVAAPATKVTTMTSSDSMKEVIHFLEEFDNQYQRMREMIETLESERAHLSNRVQNLETQVSRLPQIPSPPVTPEQLAEDSKTLFAIMERARKLLQIDPASAASE